MASDRSFMSKRARENTAGSFPYYFGLFFDVRGNVWSNDNPDGALIMSIAENNLSVDLLQEKLKMFKEVPAAGFGYGELGGEMELRESFVKLLNSTFLPETKLDPRKMVITAGVAAALEALFFSILDPGDGILFPAPFYAGYKFDIKYRAQGKWVAVYIDQDQDIKKQLTEAKEKSESEGVPIKGLNITNPENPNGVIYPESFLREAAEWCADNQLHLIANEVYANTIFNEEPVAFRSLFEIGQSLGREELKDRLHLMYGLSKDFCGSGLRVGIYYSESESIGRFVTSSCVVVNASHLLQEQLAFIFKDEAFVHSFIKENKRRVRTNYEILADGLKEAKIPFVRPQGGIFLWLDLREFLPTPDSEGEEQLCRELAKAGLLLSPGESFSAPVPGFFRICFCTAPPSAIPLAVQRLRNFQKK